MLVRTNSAPRIVLIEDYVSKASVSVSSPFQGLSAMNCYVS